jgi:probable F420-dependent oxidoreductase
MEIGVYYPQTEIGINPDTLATFAQTVESIGFDYIVVYDHVIATDLSASPELAGRYSPGDPIGEVFVTLAYIAASTRTLGLVTGVLILPQRQTVLVAKQSSIVDVLSAGRLRLGVGLGWNERDYRALGASWPNRASLLREQVAVLRQLWSGSNIDFRGQFHDIQGSIHPTPLQDPIPIWFGGAAEPMLRRGAELGDGFMLLSAPDEDGANTVSKLRRMVEQSGRDVQEFGIEGRVHLGGASRSQSRSPKSRDDLSREIDWWRRQNASHLTFNTRWSNLDGVDSHLRALSGIHALAASITG